MQTTVFVLMLGMFLVSCEFAAGSNTAKGKQQADTASDDEDNDETTSTTTADTAISSSVNPENKPDGVKGDVSRDSQSAQNAHGSTGHSSEEVTPSTTSNGTGGSRGTSTSTTSGGHDQEQERHSHSMAGKRQEQIIKQSSDISLSTPGKAGGTETKVIESHQTDVIAAPTESGKASSKHKTSDSTASDSRMPSIAQPEQRPAKVSSPTKTKTENKDLGDTAKDLFPAGHTTPVSQDTTYNKGKGHSTTTKGNPQKDESKVDTKPPLPIVSKELPQRPYVDKTDGSLCSSSLFALVALATLAVAAAAPAH